MGQTTVQSQSQIHQPRPPKVAVVVVVVEYYKASAKEATVVVVVVVAVAVVVVVHTFCSFPPSQVTLKYTRQLSSTLGKKPGRHKVLFCCCLFLMSLLF